MVWAPILLPAAVALLLPSLRRFPRLFAAAALAGLAAALGAAAWMANASSPPAAVWGWGPQLQLRLEAVGFARAMAVLVPAVALPVTGYALAVEKGGRTRLVTLMVAFVGAMELLVLAADFLTLLFAWELVGALSWSLIGHAWGVPDNPERAAHAFLTTRLGDLGLYLAAGSAFAATGSLTFSELPQAGGVQLGLVGAGVLLAAAAKSAQLPFSPWLFSAMAGPTPVSALLHSATMVASGAYLLIRLAPVLEPVGWFGPAVTVVGLVTALVGGLVAVVQTHPKKVLAASTSAQYGLMFVAVGVGFPAVAAVHLVVHALFKALLFLSSGVAIHASGSTDLSKMQLGRRLPGIAALSGVGSLALAAVPPMGGAWSKEQIVAAAAHSSVWLAVGVLLAGLLSTVYAFRYQLLAYGKQDLIRGSLSNGPPVPGPQTGGPPGRAVTACLAVLAFGTLLLSLLWLSSGKMMAERIAAGELAAGATVELIASLALLAVGAGGVAVLACSGRLASMGLPGRITMGMADWMGLPGLVRVLVVDPVLSISRGLARFDKTVVDAGVRGAVAVANMASRVLSFRVEVGVDSAVRAIAGAVALAGRASRVADDRGVDAAIEGLAEGVGLAGERATGLQTGMSHHYFVMVAGGLALIAGVLALGR